TLDRQLLPLCSCMARIHKLSFRQSRQYQLAIKYALRRSSQIHRLTITGPCNMRLPSRQVDRDFRVKVVTGDAGDHRGRRATTAGQRFPHTTLEYAQADVLATDNLHAVDIGMIG